MEYNNEIIYDEDGNIFTGDLDLEDGELRYESRVKTHHDAVEEQEAVYETRILEGTEDMAEGGLKTIVMVSPHVAPQEAWDEYETITIYHKFTQEEKDARNIPSMQERIEAQVLYTAMMTGTLIDFSEDNDDEAEIEDSTNGDSEDSNTNNSSKDEPSDKEQVENATDSSEGLMEEKEDNSSEPGSVGETTIEDILDEDPKEENISVSEGDMNEGKAKDVLSEGTMEQVND